MTSREPATPDDELEKQAAVAVAMDAAAPPPLKQAPSPKTKRQKKKSAAASPGSERHAARNEFKQNMIEDIHPTWVIRTLLEESHPSWLPIIFAGFCAWVIAPTDATFRLNAMRLELSRLMRMREQKLLAAAAKDGRHPIETFMTDSKYAALISDVYIPLGGIGKITAAGRRSTLRKDFKLCSKHFEFCVGVMQIFHARASLVGPPDPQRLCTVKGALTYLETKGISEKQREKLAGRQESITRKRKRQTDKTDKAPKNTLGRRSIEQSWSAMSTTSALWYAATFIKAAKLPKKKRAKKPKTGITPPHPVTLADHLSNGTLSYRLAKSDMTKWLQTAAAIDKHVLKRLNLNYWKTKPVKLPADIDAARLPRCPISDPSEIEAIGKALAAAATETN